MKINKTWKKLLKKTLKEFPNYSIKNVLLKTKKRFNKYKKKINLK